MKRQSVNYECPKRNFSILLNMERVLLLNHKMYSSGGAESINCCYNSISLFSFYMQSWDQVIVMRETQQRKPDFIYIYCDILCTSEHLAVMEPYCFKINCSQKNKTSHHSEFSIDKFIVLKISQSNPWVSAVFLSQ